MMTMQIDVGSALILGADRAGKGGEGIGQHQTDGDGKGGVDGAGPDHVRIVAGGPDGKAQPGFQEQNHGDTRKGGNHNGGDQLVGSAQSGFQEGEQCISPQ